MEGLRCSAEGELISEVFVVFAAAAYTSPLCLLWKDNKISDRIMQYIIYLYNYSC